MTETTQEAVAETTETTATETPKKAAAKKAAAKKAPAKKAESKRPVAKDKKNGISRPRPDTVSGKIWKVADEISKKMQKPAPRKDVLAECAKDELNPATVATQYGRWCKYHGLSNPRVSKEEAAEAVGETADQAVASDAEQAAAE